MTVPRYCVPVLYERKCRAHPVRCTVYSQYTALASSSALINFYTHPAPRSIRDPAQALLHVLAKSRVGRFARDRRPFAPDLPLRSALLLRAQECEPTAEDSDRGAEGGPIDEWRPLELPIEQWYRALADSLVDALALRRITRRAQRVRSWPLVSVSTVRRPPGTRCYTAPSASDCQWPRALRWVCA